MGVGRFSTLQTVGEGSALYALAEQAAGGGWCALALAGLLIGYRITMTLITTDSPVCRALAFRIVGRQEPSEEGLDG